MALILAIESDKRQVNYLTAMVRGKLHAELVLGDTAEGALERLGNRVPDLILTSALLSPKDEQALGDRLRRLNGVAAHVQMLTLPVLAPPSARHAPKERGSVLSALLGSSSQPSAPDGCDPAVFAEQCREYLRRSADERDARRHEDANVATVETDIAQPDTAPEVEADGAITVDIDLSDLLDDGDVSARAAAGADEDEPAVYDLSAESLDLRSAAAPIEETPPAAPEPAADDDFDDWQKVVDALKRESAQVRVPRDRKPDPRAVQTAPKSAPPAVPPPPAPAPPAQAAAASAQAPALKIGAAEPPKRRRATADEWGMFDPAQAGMAALYERLERITQDEERR